MSDKETLASELPTEVPDRGSRAPSMPAPASMPMPCESPAAWEDEDIASTKMSALSYLKCPSCNTTYIKGDEHSC